MTPAQRRRELLLMIRDAALFIALGWGVGIWLPHLSAILTGQAG